MKKLQKSNYWNLVKIIAICAILGLWVSIPFLTNSVMADGTPVILVRDAALAAPNGAVNPHGAAQWQLYQSGNRELEVEIEDVNLAQGTVLSAVVDGTVIGQLVVDDRQKARLKLKTEDGQTVPVVNNGSTVQVRNGTTMLASGAFGGGGATPSPTVSPTGSPSPSPSSSPSPSPSVSPTGSPSPSPSASASPSPSPGESEIFAGLSGATLNGAVPTGYATYEIHSSRTELEVRVRQVNLPIGTSLTVTVNGTAAGTMSLQSGGEGRLRLRSDSGQTVPVVNPGMPITIDNGGTTIMSGTFSSMSGTPSPSATPTGTPGVTPSPTPAFGRSFESHLTGAGMSPSVSTAATGEIKVTLNAAETQATVFGEFHNLSSNQTGARIETTVGTVTTIRDLGIVGGSNGNFASATFSVTAAQVQQLRAGVWSAVITSVNNSAGEIRGGFRQRGGGGDLNGDGINDFAVFRPSTGVWYAANTEGITIQSFGTASDRVVSGDYDGDGKTDVSVYRDAGGQGVWEIKRSSDGGVTSVAWGLPSDKPVRGDFDGDGRLDFAVYRPSNGAWYILKSDNTGFSIAAWGIAEDIPAPADMDGDGKDDLVVFRPSTGAWYWLRSSDGQFAAATWGLNGDIPTPADFDGDGKRDLAVFRPSSGTWYWLRSSDGQFAAASWGLNGDIPVVGNYDQDGKADIAVFRPSDGNWYVLRSSDLGFEVFNFGLSGDIPLVAR